MTEYSMKLNICSEYIGYNIKLKVLKTLPYRWLQLNLCGIIFFTNHPQFYLHYPHKFLVQLYI